MLDVADEIFTASRCHWYVNVGDPASVQVPVVDESVCPTTVDPVTTGATVLTGAAGGVAKKRSNYLYQSETGSAVVGALLPDGVVVAAIEIAVPNVIPAGIVMFAAPDGGIPSDKFGLVEFSVTDP